MAINAHEENLGQILWDSNIYLVPPYQRNYSWESDQINTLWTDLMRVTFNADTYFLGSMVFVKTASAMVFDVLDGQQRFASLLLMVAAFRDLIRAQDPDSTHLNGINQVILKVDVTGRFNNSDVVHIRLNHQDEDFFETLMTTSKAPRPMHSSHKLLVKNFDAFKSLIQKECAARGITVEHLWAKLRDVTTSRLYVIRITVDDYVNAQQVFQALNSAGLELSQADLIKNYVLMEAGKGSFDQALKLWLETTQTVGDMNLTQYTRTYWNSNHSFVRTNDLYKRLSEKVKLHPDLEKSEVDALLFLRQLRDEALVYYALRNPDIAYWDSASLVQDLADLRDLKATMIYVPILAARYVLRDDNKSFGEVVKWCLDFYVRHTVVGGRAANEVEELYTTWAVDLRRGKMTVGQLSGELTRLSPDDDDFHKDLLAYSVNRLKTAQILLARINDSVNPENAIRKTVTTGGTVHVEHIIPQQPDKWAAFLESEGLVHEDVVNRFGNLTLLLGPKNQAASNREFCEKLPVYQADGDPEPLNTMLTDSRRFGATELDARQRWLADRALGVWSSLSK